MTRSRRRNPDARPPQRPGLSRRRFLRGLGGMALALPFLESLGRPREALAAEGRPIYSVFVRQGNGVQQAWQDEPERFWPSQTGAISRASLEAESDRAISELKDYADRLLLVRGVDYGFDNYDCGHSGGIAQCLTAADHTGGTGNDDYALGISVDTRIAEALTPGTPPLNLVAARVNAYIGPNLSYLDAEQRRPAESNPYNVYLDLFANSGQSPEVIDRLAVQRNSVNDLVREELQALMRRDLSYDDRQRLQLHFDSIRDLETTMACQGLDQAALDNLDLVNGDPEGEDLRDLVVDLHMQLVALAFACDLRRTATLQIGTGNDQTKYVIDGQKLPYSFHWISHRRQSDGSDGELISGADVLHHQIDRKFAGYFRSLLGYLDQQSTVAGYNLLDDSTAIWLNDLANGPPHGRSNLPYVIAGSGGGFLEQGQYVDAGGVTHNKFLNTILSAVGVRKADGNLVDDFGDPTLEPGLIPEMMTGA